MMEQIHRTYFEVSLEHMTIDIEEEVSSSYICYDS